MTDFLNLPAGGTVIIGCSSRKKSFPCRALNMYQGALFKKAKRYAEIRGKEILILSAKYGLLKPDQKIEPYNLSLNSFSVAEKKAWAEKVTRQMSEIEIKTPIIVFAGRNYYQFLPWKSKKNVFFPLKNLGIGKQLAWFTDKERRIK